jgi:hypothetical protein
LNECAEETPADGDSKGDSKADGKGTGLEASASGGDGDGSDAKEGAGEDDDSVRACVFVGLMCVCVRLPCARTLSLTLAHPRVPLQDAELTEEERMEAVLVGKPRPAVKEGEVSARLSPAVPLVLQ